MASMASSIPTQQLGWVFGGIDTHKDTHTAALVDSAGMLLGSAVFPTTQAGYRQLLGWMGSAGALGPGWGGGHRQLRRRDLPPPVC